MVEEKELGTQARHAKEDPEALMLRARARPVVRFRRSVIVGLTAAVSAFVVALAWLALEPHSFRIASEAPTDERIAHPAPDTLAGAPLAYSDVPRLGPPLPGDLGRPILERQRELSADAQTTDLPSNQSEAERRIAADQERYRAAAAAARSSPVTVQLSSLSPQPTSVSDGPAVPASASGLENPSASGRASQQEKIAFAGLSDDAKIRHEIEPALSNWTLAAGTIIPASLITGLNSDLPGLVLAQVTQNVRDSATGRTVLIPQGSRLVGKYDSSIAYGQKRALVVWQRILFPNGSSLELNNMPATDAGGYAGLSDHVNQHSWQLIKGAAVSTLLGLGAELSIAGEGQLVRAVREATQQNSSQAGEQLVSRDLDVQPTLIVRPGWPVRVLVNQDILLPPWKG